MLIRSLAVHELAVLGAIPKAFIDACVVVIASTAVHKLFLSVGGLYAVVPALAVKVVDAATTHDIVGSAPAHYLILAPTAGEVVGVAPSDDIVVFRQPGDRVSFGVPTSLSSPAVPTSVAAHATPARAVAISSARAAATKARRILAAIAFPPFLEVFACPKTIS
jgi:hypothetical protein